MNKLGAALFDLDGVVLDTESQYSIFWGEQGRIYHPEIPRFDIVIKGQTLAQIYEKHFAHIPEEQPVITARLNEFERNMAYTYIKGAEEFLLKLRKEGIPTALVTSSNDQKMRAVYQSHPELKDYFQAWITADKVTHSKPHPECFLLGAESLGVAPERCIVFEDSLHGLAAARAAQTKVVALATTYPADELQGKGDMIIPDFQALSVSSLEQALF